MKRNIWHPDTCGCEVEYEWDSGLPPDQRTHKLVRVIKACSVHSDLAQHVGKTLETDEVHFHRENQRKNSAFAIIKEAQASFEVEDFNWSYDKDRILHVTLPTAFSSLQKTQIQVLCDQRLGTDKIRIT